MQKPMFITAGPLYAWETTQAAAAASLSDATKATKATEVAPAPGQPEPRLTWSGLTSGRASLVPAFEAYLRDKGWPYVRVDEAKKVIFGASGTKGFDFLVYSSSGPNLLVLIATRKPTAEQVERMREWEKVFGAGFLAAFTVRAGGVWRVLSLQNLQAPGALGRSRPVEECI